MCSCTRYGRSQAAKTDLVWRENLRHLRHLRRSHHLADCRMLYDLTPRITPKLGVWPGDTPPGREVLLDLARGDTVTLSTLRATVHLGAHADAPSHYGLDAPAIDRRELSYYLGLCQVIRVALARNTRVEPEQLTAPILAPRILIDTGTFPEPERWNDDFGALSPRLVDALHQQGVRLVGIDTPSVDLLASKDLPAHQAFLRHDMAILEGLRLAGVPEGLYELIALPLPLEGFDASPVRAVLRTLPATPPSSSPPQSASAAG